MRPREINRCPPQSWPSPASLHQQISAELGERKAERKGSEKKKAKPARTDAAEIPGTLTSSRIACPYTPLRAPGNKLSRERSPWEAGTFLPLTRGQQGPLIPWPCARELGSPPLQCGSAFSPVVAVHRWEGARKLAGPFGLCNLGQGHIPY